MQLLINLVHVENSNLRQKINTFVISWKLCAICGWFGFHNTQFYFASITLTMVRSSVSRITFDSAFASTYCLCMRFVSAHVLSVCIIIECTRINYNDSICTCYRVVMCNSDAENRLVVGRCVCERVSMSVCHAHKLCVNSCAWLRVSSTDNSLQCACVSVCVRALNIHDKEKERKKENESKKTIGIQCGRSTRTQHELQQRIDSDCNYVCFAHRFALLFDSNYFVMPWFIIIQNISINVHVFVSSVCLKRRWIWSFRFNNKQFDVWTCSYGHQQSHFHS